MLPASSKNRQHLISCCLLLIVCIIGFWPLSFNVFSVKNDAIHYFLPFRYNISCAIQNGELPFWSPFIYLGYPLHGDMQSGAWNPFVLLISLFTRYNLTIFHVEYLFYIFIAGVGMYKLSGILISSVPVRLFVATAYMLSGYIYGSGQFINWIASAAFIPFVLDCYYRFLIRGGRTYATGTAVSFWLLLVCGYPADMVYVFYIMLAMVIVAIFKNKTLLKNSEQRKKYITGHLLIILLFTCLSLPALISYIELLPYYNRGSGTSYTQAIQNSFELKNIISFLDPMVVWTNDFASVTDPTGRNIFTGIVVLPLFVLSFFSPLNRIKKFLVWLLVISFLFCLGDMLFLRKLLYYVLPGMSEFRHPSHFRLYIIIPLLLLAGCGLNLLSSGENFPTIFRYILFVFLSLCILLTISALLFHTTSSLSMPDFSSGMLLKEWLNTISKKQVLMLGAFMQSIFLGSLLLVYKKQRFIVIFFTINLLNLFLFQSCFPVNFVSKTKPEIINQIIYERRAERSGDMLLQTLKRNSSDAFEHFKDAGLTYFYNKKIGISRITNSPSFLRTQKEFLTNDFLYHYVESKPVIYFSDRYLLLNDSLETANTSACVASYTETKNPILNDSCRSASNKLLKTGFNFNYFEAEVFCVDSSILNLSQNFQPNWKVEVDGHPGNILPANHTFMSVILPAGRHSVKWFYDPRHIETAIIFSLVAFVCALGALIANIIQNKK